MEKLKCRCGEDGRIVVACEKCCPPGKFKDFTGGGALLQSLEVKMIEISRLIKNKKEMDDKNLELKMRNILFRKDFIEEVKRNVER